MYLAKIRAYTSQKEENRNMSILGSKLIKEFDLKVFLGAGAFGIVLKGTNKFDNTSYAIKVLVEAGTVVSVKVKNEIKVLSKISSHQNVVSYKSSWMDSVEKEEFLNVLKEISMSPEEMNRLQFDLQPFNFNIVCIQMELCGPDLKAWLCKNARYIDNVEDKIRWKMFCQIVKGLKHIHRCNIIHRGLKPENIFVCDKQVKIGDLGIAKALSTKAMTHSNLTIVGTKMYMAPEQNTSQYGKSVDIYSLGLILAELFSFVKTRNHLLTLLLSVRCHLIPLHITKKWPTISTLILTMVQEDPNERIHLHDISKICKVIKRELMQNHI